MLDCNLPQVSGGTWSVSLDREYRVTLELKIDATPDGAHPEHYQSVNFLVSSTTPPPVLVYRILDAAADLRDELESFRQIQLPYLRLSRVISDLQQGKNTVAPAPKPGMESEYQQQLQGIQ